MAKRRPHASTRSLARQGQPPRRERPPRKQRPAAPPDCCEMRVLTYGMTKTSVTALAGAVSLDQNLRAATTVNAAAHTDYDVRSEAMDHVHAAAIAAGGPAADSEADAVADTQADSSSDAASDSGADTAVGLVERRPQDLLAKVDDFIVRWNVINAHGQVVVSVALTGLVNGNFQCAEREGQLQLANLAVVRSDQPLVKGFVDVLVEARDACGGYSTCGFRLREG